jgi:hypothetical protein
MPQKCAKREYLLYDVQCFIEISATGENDNLACEIIYGHFIIVVNLMKFITWFKMVRITDVVQFLPRVLIAYGNTKAMFSYIIPLKRDLAKRQMMLRY